MTVPGRATVIAWLMVTAVAFGYASGAAHAQGFAYRAEPPTNGALYRDGQTGRYLLGGIWLYRSDLGDIGLDDGWWRPLATTAGWSPVSVPNAYNVGDLSSASMSGYVGWYRRDFTLPSGSFARSAASADRHWIIRFESVNYRATIWLNGHRVGAHVGAYVPFELDLKGIRPGVNRLIVRVDDRRGLGDLPPGPGGGWWNYGGILREVYLRSVQEADLAQVQVTPELPCRTCAAVISEQASMRNLGSAPRTVRLRGLYGRTPVDFGRARIGPHATWTARAIVPVTHPQLWAPGHPYLYRATLTLLDSSGRRLGGYVTYSGIRSVSVTRDGRLELNGRLVDLRGINLHEQDRDLGAALDVPHMRRLIGWTRALGATVIRSHYPFAPELEELADRYGILIWSEVPVYQVRSRYLLQHGWLARAKDMLEANILANENHPSVMLWSIGNELATPADAAEAGYISAAAALAHRLDPSRPVGMAVSDWPGMACQPAYAPLDAIGFNDYFGWYDAGGGQTDDRDALGSFLDGFRACYPRQALFVTEFGFESNRHGPIEERGTYEFQADAITYHLDVFGSKPWLSGAMYFALQDFAARPGWAGGDPWPDPPWVQKGVVDGFGRPKPAFPLLAAAYRATVQIARARGRRPQPRRSAGL